MSKANDKIRGIMTIQAYRQLVDEGLNGLPTETLAEIVSYIYFIRKRTLQPELFAQDLKYTMLSHELEQLDRDEAAHLEEEFNNYDKLYPRQ